MNQCFLGKKLKNNCVEESSRPLFLLDQSRIVVLCWEKVPYGPGRRKQDKTNSTKSTKRHVYWLISPQYSQFASQNINSAASSMLWTASRSWAHRWSQDVFARRGWRSECPGMAPLALASQAESWRRSMDSPGKFSWFMLISRVLQHTKSLPGDPTKRQMRGAPFHQLGLGVEPVSWMALEPTSITVGGRLNNCGKLKKKVLMGVQWYSVRSSQPQI